VSGWRGKEGQGERGKVLTVGSDLPLLMSILCFGMDEMSNRIVHVQRSRRVRHDEASHSPLWQRKRSGSAFDGHAIVYHVHLNRVDVRSVDSHSAFQIERRVKRSFGSIVSPDGTKEIPTGKVKGCFDVDLRTSDRISSELMERAISRLATCPVENCQVARLHTIAFDTQSCRRRFN
jgi:hypothetical protein